MWWGWGGRWRLGLSATASEISGSLCAGKEARLEVLAAAGSALLWGPFSDSTVTQSPWPSWQPTGHGMCWQPTSGWMRSGAGPGREEGRSALGCWEWVSSSWPGLLDARARGTHMCEGVSGVRGREGKAAGVPGRG